MYIQSIKFNTAGTTSYKTNPYYHAQNIRFAQSIKSQKQITDLVDKYILNFSLNISDFEARIGEILQPSGISRSVLNTIAEKSLKELDGKPANKLFYIVSGRIGSGKTTFVQRKNFAEFCYLPDADNIKPFLPGYIDKGSTYVHMASSSINTVNLYEAFNRGLNVVYQTSTKENYLDGIIAEAKKYGYKNIIMFHINTNEQNSINRAMKRGEQTGRIIKPEVIKRQKYVDDFVSIYKNPDKGLSELIVYDNNSAYFVEKEHYYFQ